MKEQLTTVFQKVPEGYIGFVEEMPGTNTQGATLDEARANLQEAVRLILEFNRALASRLLPFHEAVRVDPPSRTPLSSVPTRRRQS